MKKMEQQLKGTQQNVKEEDKQNSNSELIQRDDVKDTPFTIITTEEGSFIVMGKYRLSEPYKNKEEAREEANKISWNRIVQVVMLLWQEVNEQPIKTK